MVYAELMVDVDAKVSNEPSSSPKSLHARVRSPTGNAWLASLAAMVAFGEIGYEWYDTGVVNIFHTTLHSSAALTLTLSLALILALMLLWLISLYVRPGHLLIQKDVNNESFFIERRLGGVRQHVLRADASAWQVHALFFDTKDRDRHYIKRLELSCGDSFREVLLFGDFRRPEEAVEALLSLAEKLGKLSIEVERP